MFTAASGASCVIAGVCAVGAKKKGVLHAALRDLKREKREKRRGKEKGKRGKGNRALCTDARVSKAASEASCVIAGVCGRRWGGVGAPQARGLTCKETQKI